MAKVNNKYIFLDFDGVLHTLKDAYKNNMFSQLFLLDNFVKEIVEKGYVCNIVVSSAWRLNRNINELKDILNKDTCGDENNIGKLLKLNKVKIYKTCQEKFSRTYFKKDKKQFNYQNNRYLEIQDFINNYRILFGDYVVIDDSASLFFKSFINKNKKVLLNDGTEDYDVNITYLIADAFNKIINNDYINYNGEYELNNFDKKMIEFNKSFVLTFKKEINDGLLSQEDIEKAKKILKL